MLQDSNVKNRLLDMLQEEHPNYHPLLALAEIALERDDEDRYKNDPKLRADCHKTIAKYVEPELRSVEMSGNVKSDFGHLRVTIMDETDDEEPEEPEEPKDDETNYQD